MSALTEQDGYGGWTNYATCSINLWVDWDERDYQLKVDFLTTLCHPVNRSDVRRFVFLYMGDSTPDLKGATEPGCRFCDISWQELAEAWESERRELLG